MRISVFGLGYVGAVSCGCLGDLGHEVIGVDVAEPKVDLLNRGESPITETGLPEILARVHAAGRLRATTCAAEAVASSDAALVCVGTPSTRSGGVDASYLERVCTQIGEAVRRHDPPRYTLLNRSTSLPAVHRRLVEILEAASGRRVGPDVGYVCHPEFLREGAAVQDFHDPPKIVFGISDPQDEACCRALYPGIDAPTFFVSADVASMVKYADNCFHAVKVTFGNEIGLMCREYGVNSHAVMDVFCADRKLNISPRYLRPGFAFGGSCLPKDLRAILDGSRRTATPLPMLAGTLESNRVQVERLLRRVLSPQRPTIGIVGLAFKEGTDDVRESPLVDVVEQACGKGHPVLVYDEHLALGSLVGANLSFALQSIPHLAELLTDDLQRVVDAAEILIVSHRLTPERWGAIAWKEGQRIVDLVNVEALHGRPGYEGLYW